MKMNYFKIWGLVLFTVLCINTESMATDCTPTPDCATLGFTKTASDCSGADIILKCPTDTSKVACSAVTYGPKVGYILYSDKTFSPNVEAGKTPIGVIFDEENRLALALTDVKKDGSAGTEFMLWSKHYGVTPNIEYCKDSNTILTCEIDGRANTDAILASDDSEAYEAYEPYAANAVNSYQPSNCNADFCRKGKWFLPSIRDLYTIYSFKSVINNSLTLLASIGASNLGRVYWSSNEYFMTQAWYLYMSDGSRHYSYKYTDNLYVRPVLAF